MTRIELHIENLLLSHDCVIVPGIGGFVTRYEESFFSEDGKDLFPPYRSISFNSQLKTNDGLLVQSYMNAYDTSYPNAQQLVEEDARLIRENLYKTGEFVFNSLGKIQLTQSQSIIFVPAEEVGIYSKELYGLSMCTLLAFSNNTNQEDDHITTEPQENNVAQNKPHSNPIKSDNGHYVIRVSKNAVRYTISTIAAALLYFIFTIAPSVDTSDSGVQQASIIKTTHIDTKKKEPVTTQKQHVQKQQENNFVEAQGEDVRQKEVTSSPTPDINIKEQYTIVIASAIEESGAEYVIQELKECNLNQAQFIHDGKMTRIIYSSFPSRQEAASVVKELRSKHKRFARAWVMKL